MYVLYVYMHKHAFMIGLILYKNLEYYFTIYIIITAIVYMI